MRPFAPLGWNAPHYFESGSPENLRHQRFQRLDDLLIFNVCGIRKLLAVFIPHGAKFRAFLDVVQDSGDICDLLRSRSSMEIQTFQGALKMYARRKDKDLRTLMRYAGMFRVEKILRQYLEVLL